MLVVEEGVWYTAQCLGDPENGQDIMFPTTKPDGFGGFEIVVDGIKVEELIEIAKARIQFLQDKLACEENIDAIAGLDKALFFLDKRKRDREKRGVLGSTKT